MEKEEAEIVLERNLRAFKKALPALLEEQAGKYAVGNADDGFSCWDSYEDASQAGWGKYGLETPFIIKRVLRPELDRETIFYASVAA